MTKRGILGIIWAIISIYLCSFLGSLEHRWWIFPTVLTIAMSGGVGIMIAVVNYMHGKKDE